MANKKTLRKAETTNKLSVKEMLSPNIRIVALLVVAGALLTAVTAVSMVSMSKKKTQSAKLAAAENSKIHAAEGANGESEGKLSAPVKNTAESSETASDTANAQEISNSDTVSSSDAIALTSTSDDTTESGKNVVTKAKPNDKMLPFDGTLSYGDDHKAVESIQERLMLLAYMDADEVTDHFGPITRDAVSTFQRKNGLDVTGKVDADTYHALMSDDAAVNLMTIGDSGDDVASIQDRLHEMGYLSIKPTGYFGDTTEGAVKAFQKNNDLTADGKVGVETKNQLYSEDVVPNFWTKGDNSEQIVPYQKKLISLGYLTGKADGTYGSSTISAVKRFQDRNALPVDGYLGPKTKDMLMSSDAVANAYVLGDNSPEIEKFQKKLYKLGYSKKSAITGYFGSATEYAVKAFQKRNDLTVDGRVGVKTLKAIMSDDAKKPSSSYKFYGESNNSGNSGNSGNNSSNSGSGSSYTPPEGSSLTKFLSAAKSRLGCRYVTGAKGPDRFDCSGLVYWCLNQAGVRQSYLTSYGWRSVSKYQRISKIDNLRAGDVIVFYGHVGIIVSDSEMIDASSGKGKVVRRSFKGSWSRRNFICGYRIFD